MRPHRALHLVLIVLMAWGLVWVNSPAPAAEKRPQPEPVKSIIVLIADGCGAEQYTLARWFKGAPLALDQICVGAVKTYTASSVVADSAAAATAFATGYRASGTSISVGPGGSTLTVVPAPDPSLSYKPLATVLEGARLLGKATGVVVTCRVTDATPAAYYAHAPVRTRENDIMEQGVYQNLDVVLGGGQRYLLPSAEGGSRKDGENLREVLRERGYALPASAQELGQVTAGKVCGLFAVKDMAPEIDRAAVAPRQPTLEDMTRKAIELLAANPKGFFLMVEASQVDWACHANDPAYLLSDLMMFDRAVAAALDYARRDQNTLVLAFSDHNCGGLSIGNQATNRSYSRLKVETLIAPLQNMKLSAEGIWRELGPEAGPEKVQEVVKKFWGLAITGEEAEQILALAKKYPGSPHFALGEVLCPKYTGIGWTTHGHTGGDVPLFAFGPRHPSGLVDGPDIGKTCAAALGLDLDRLNGRLFQEAGAALADGQVTLDTADPENPVVRIAYKGRLAELPVNKNILRLDGKQTDLEGVVVYAPHSGKAYIPAEAVNLIKGSSCPLPAITGD
jgi:alkaline phosphatase